MSDNDSDKAAHSSDEDQPELGEAACSSIDDVVVFFEAQEINPLEMHLLAYVAQGMHLAIFNRPLFPDVIELGCRHHPFCFNYRYRDFRKNPLTSKGLTPEVRDFLTDILVLKNDDLEDKVLNELNSKYFTGACAYQHELEAFYKEHIDYFWFARRVECRRKGLPLDDPETYRKYELRRLEQMRTCDLSFRDIR